MRIEIWLIVASLVLTAPAFAQRGLIQEGYREFPAPPQTLTAPPMTTEAIAAAQGNLQRWRDAERGRIGPYVRENEIENARLRSAYQSALATQSENPPGWGFGEAALRIAAEGYRVAPELRGGGSSLGRKVCLGTAFRLE